MNSKTAGRIRRRIGMLIPASEAQVAQLHLGKEVGLLFCDCPMPHALSLDILFYRLDEGLYFALASPLD